VNAGRFYIANVFINDCHHYGMALGEAASKPYPTKPSLTLKLNLNLILNVIHILIHILNLIINLILILALLVGL